jgi:excisionase family DNA binding protein
MDDFKLLNISELCKILGVEKSWVYAKTRLKDEKTIPHIRVGKYLRFQLEKVIEWLETTHKRK